MILTLAFLAEEEENDNNEKTEDLGFIILIWLKKNNTIFSLCFRINLDDTLPIIGRFIKCDIQKQDTNFLKWLWTLWYTLHI